MITMVAGNIRHFVDEWRKITSDKFILDTVQHSHIDFFEGMAPIQNSVPKPIKFNEQEKIIVNGEVLKLLNKGVIEPCQPERTLYVSNIFIREKKDGSFRTILNLSELNKSVEYHKFKMETLDSIVKLLRPNCFMASLDLKDAYYSVPIAPEDRVFLRFWWNDTLYQYTCFPNGLTSAPRKFTKLMKPVLASLRLLGYTNAIYIDDAYLQGDSVEDCIENVEATEVCFTSLGFTINDKKSVREPSQQLTMLGFILDSRNMTVRLTPQKARGVRVLCEQMRAREYTSLQKLAELIGKLCSSFPGVETGPLHYRELEALKCRGLKASRGNFSGTVRLTKTALDQLDWWIENVEMSFKPISHGEPTVVLETDASKKGWGATVRGGRPTGGRWDLEESKLHINVLEMIAVLFGLKCFCSNVTNTHVRVFVDNSTAVSYINEMGGMKSELCNRVAIEIWDWCQVRGIWLSACHIPGEHNIEADQASRVFNDRTEWMLNHDMFLELTSAFFLPEIDLFASRINKQLPRFVAWQADPEAEAIDAFMLQWKGLLIYLFPPFSLISKCVQKLVLDSVEDALLVVPMWPTQPWFTQVTELLVDHPRLIPMNNLSLPGTKSDKVQPMKVQLMGCHCSTNQLRSREFRRKLPPSSWTRGQNPLENSTVVSSKSGLPFVVKKRLVHFKRL